MRKILISSLAIALIASTAMAAAPKKPAPASSAPPAQVKLTPTQEIFVVYEIMCVKPGGKLEKAQPAITKLESTNTIKPVTDAETLKVFKPDSKVWATKTSTTPMYVVYDPAGICALHVQKADPKAMKAEFVSYVNNVKTGLKGNIIKKADDKKQDDDLYSYYIVAKPGAKAGAGFGLSSPLDPSKALAQDILTFNLAKPE